MLSLPTFSHNSSRIPLFTSPPTLKTASRRAELPPPPNIDTLEAAKSFFVSCLCRVVSKSPSLSPHLHPMTSVAFTHAPRLL